LTKREFLSELEKMALPTICSLQGSEQLKDLGWWDSLQSVDFVLMVEQKFGAVIDGEAVSQAKTVDDLINFAAPYLHEN